MELRLERLQLDPDVTIGALTTDGAWECWTLEDTVRAPGVKVPGLTAIPYGSYAVDINFSPKFQRPMPLVMNVPNFLGVRIHPGNMPADTDGCILVGQDRLSKSIGRSRGAFDTLFIKLQNAIARHEAVTLRIVPPGAP